MPNNEDTVSTEYSPPSVSSEVGRELRDIILLAKSVGMSSQSLEAAFLGHIGVNVSCWPKYLLSRVPNQKDPTASSV